VKVASRRFSEAVFGSVRDANIVEVFDDNTGGDAEDMVIDGGVKGANNNDEGAFEFTPSCNAGSIFALTSGAFVTLACADAGDVGSDNTPFGDG
jgi:hypothetical protein